MTKTSDHSTTRSISAYFFLIVALFLLTGFMPQYLNYLGADCLEFSETIEDESEEGKKENKKESENETDKYQSELVQYALFNSGNLIVPDGHFHKWQNPSADIITPPPDFI